jgi:transcriptional regulator with XRE-family HTH domain
MPPGLRLPPMARNVPDIVMTPAQLRAARALIDWSRERLAEESGMHVNAVRNFETGVSDPKRSTLIAWRTALAKAGVGFADGADEHGPGVRLRRRR